MKHEKHMKNIIVKREERGEKDERKELEYHVRDV